MFRKYSFVIICCILSIPLSLGIHRLYEKMNNAKPHLNIHSYCKLETSGSLVRIPYCIYIQIPETGDLYSFKRIKSSKLTNNLLTVVYEIDTKKPPIDKIQRIEHVQVIE